MEAWRQRIRLILETRPNLRVIGEASDGVEALQKAEALKPDLILLDVGLPKLDGIEAARQIRRVVPESKIVFLTENYSPDVVAEALSTGAGGYVVKSDAGRELLAAVEVVIRDNRFVSARLARHDLFGTADAQKSLCSTVDPD